MSRDALNIDGLSEATLEKFIGAGFIHEYADIFHLEEHKDAIVEMEGRSWMLGNQMPKSSYKGR